MLSRQHRRARPDDPDRLLRPDLARPRRFLAIGAFTTVILTVHAGTPFRHRCAGGCESRAPSSASWSACRRCAFAASISPSARSRCTTPSFFCATSYQAKFGASASAGITIPDPVIGPFRPARRAAWYYFLLRSWLAIATCFCVNLVRTRPGRAWMAIRDRDIAAEALGINLDALQAAGVHAQRDAGIALGQPAAYYSNVVTVEAYTLDLADHLCRDDHRRRHGLDPREAAGRGVHHAAAVRHRVACSSFCPGTWRFGPTMFGVQVGVDRRLHHPVPAVRAEGPRRDLAAHRDLLRALAVPLPAARQRRGGDRMAARTAARSPPARGRLQPRRDRDPGRVARRAGQARSSRWSAPTARARPRRCAPSPGSCRRRTPQSPTARSHSSGQRIDGQLPHQLAGPASSSCPERDKVFDTLSVRDNLLVRAREGGADHSRHGPALLPAPARSGAPNSRAFSAAARSRCWRSAWRCCAADAAAGRRIVARPCADRHQGADGASSSSINRELGLTMLMVEQNAKAALCDRRLRLRDGRRPSRVLRQGAGADVASGRAEFYLGGAGQSENKSYRDVKQYRRKRRWWG